ncbi:unnamed protein product [Brassica oleracea]|uniref:(rape) hypothetical protein n=1 Tax=Brassica napus TaxID=3708 RepID=A0A816KK59_BRANA|nr:unnamed protein product [Brassica napus]
MGSSSPPIEKKVNRGSYEDEDEFMTPDTFFPCFGSSSQTGYRVYPKISEPDL